MRAILIGDTGDLPRTFLHNFAIDGISTASHPQPCRPNLTRRNCVFVLLVVSAANAR
jgi:hypothetical protein